MSQTYAERIQDPARTVWTTRLQIAAAVPARSTVVVRDLGHAIAITAQLVAAAGVRAGAAVGRIALRVDAPPRAARGSRAGACVVTCAAVLAVGGPVDAVSG